jgi:hypothetical protein
MQDIPVLSAEKFFVCLKEGVIPSGPYIVDEEVSIYGFDQDTGEKLELNEDVNLGEGIFRKKVNIHDVIFKKEFNFGKSNFEYVTNIGCIFEDNVIFSDSIFKTSFSFSKSKIFEYTYFNNSTFNRITFNRSSFEKQVSLDDSLIRSLSFGSATFKEDISLSSVIVMQGVSFYDVDFSFLSVGKNPAIGWLYEKSLKGILYSLKDACEMCGHSQPLAGWRKEKYEVMGNTTYYWKFDNHLNRLD